MMTLRSTVSSLSLVCLAASVWLAPAHAKSGDGLSAGDPLGAFNVVKVAGAADDGVEVGEELCYRCRYGSSPMAIVFVRSTSDDVANLVKQLDQLVSKHQTERFRTLVTFLGVDDAELKTAAEKFATEIAAKNAAITVAKDAQSGPLNYRLPADAEIAVVLARDSQVFDFQSGSAQNFDVDTIVGKIAELVKEESL